MNDLSRTLDIVEELLAQGRTEEAHELLAEVNALIERMHIARMASASRLDAELLRYATGLQQ